MSSRAVSQVDRFATATGVEIYSINIPVFEDFHANVYLIDHPDGLVLVDSGSGLKSSNQAIEEGFLEISNLFGRTWAVSDVDLILITHGHIDHFGGLVYMTEKTGAPVWVHPKDSRILSDFTRRVAGTVSSLSHFLREAGVPDSETHALMDVYRWGKDHYRSQEVHGHLNEGFIEPLGLRVFHTPGHCPGQVCIQIEDILFTGDHVLSRISPHLAPEGITPGTGLETYLESLARVASLEDVRLGLGGHEDPMPSLAERCQEIERLHFERLQDVLRVCVRPVTIRDLSTQLFGKLRRYHILLGLEEAGALLEYLEQQGEVQSQINLAGIREYCRKE